MTCIVALATEHYAVMAADRQIVDGWVAHGARSPKIVRRDEWLLGTTGPLRVNNAVKHQFIPPPGPTFITEAWVVEVFVPALRVAMLATGTAVIDGWLGGKENEQQGTVLCAYPGAVFTVQADWAVDYWFEPYAAIGTGQRFALSALFALRESGPLGNAAGHLHAVELAVRTAMEFDIYTGRGVDSLVSPEGVLP